jgi:fructose-1,6-bisphosphatase-3
MNTLMDYHTVDIQWGNHDILWIGAAAGCAACVLNVVRICMRYGNTSVLEQGYGINLIPLSIFASKTYGKDDTLDKFMPRISDEVPDIEDDLLAMMQKALAVIQFKVESKIISRHPEFHMDDRRLINKADFATGRLSVEGAGYALNTTFFPTVDPDAPDRLTAEEEKVLNALINSFVASSQLQKHIDFMLQKGSIYKVFNNNLLMHAGLPVKDDLSFKPFELDGATYTGKALLDALDSKVRRSFYIKDDIDIFWYLWCGPDSPLFGKNKMATFERYFIDDKTPHQEYYTPYFMNLNNERMAEKIFEEFGIVKSGGHIICGHVR